VAGEQLHCNDDHAVKNAVQTKPCVSTSSPVPKKAKRKSGGKKNLILEPKRVILAENLKKMVFR